MNKAFSLIGLAQRAGCIVSGSLAESAVKSGAVKLLLMDETVSDNTSKRYEGLCRTAGIPILRLPFGKLSDSIGKTRKVAAVCDGGFAENIQKQFKIYGKEIGVCPK